MYAVHADRVSLERHAVFRRHLACAADPCGTVDREVIDDAVARDGRTAV